MIARRTLLSLVFGAALVACTSSAPWHATDITGTVGSLAFSMTRANDGKAVTQADYTGRPTLLYFGYVYCPDVCPLTLANLHRAIVQAGASPKDARILFVTVDPHRDTLSVLKRYAAAFGPEVDALRGTPDQLSALARRYRVAYSVTPAAAGQPYDVTHSSGVYVFDRSGRARLLVSSLSTDQPDIDGVAADLKRLLG
jgi:protein SCO1/2